MKKNFILKIVISILVISVAIFSVILINKKLKEKSIAKNNGEIKIILMDESITVDERSISYKTGDTLWDLLYNEYKDTIDYKNDMYGVTLYSIYSLETDFTSSYLALYVNDVYSGAGISGIELSDGLILKIVRTKL